MDAKPLSAAIAAMFICLGVDLAVVWTEGVTRPALQFGFASMALLVVTALLAYCAERAYSCSLVTDANALNVAAIVTGFASAGAAVVGCILTART